MFIVMFRDYNATLTEDRFTSVDIKEMQPNYVMVVDQFAGQDFNLNEAGWIRNDLAAAVQAQSLSEYQSIVQRLVEIKQEGGIPDDMPLDKAISRIKPRWCQSPNEIEMFMQMTNDEYMSNLDDAYRKATEGKVDTPQVDDNGQAPVSRADGD